MQEIAEKIMGWSYCLYGPLIQQISNKKSKGKKLQEAWSGRKPNISHLRVLEA